MAFKSKFMRSAKPAPTNPFPNLAGAHSPIWYGRVFKINSTKTDRSAKPAPTPPIAPTYPNFTPQSEQNLCICSFSAPQLPQATVSIARSNCFRGGNPTISEFAFPGATIG
jgi:hypothetical protein